MTDDTRRMHADFPRWYSAVNVGKEETRLAARWNGIDSVVSGADRARVEALVRLSFGGKSLPASDQVQAIQSAFETADPSFEKSGNSRELQVLSAAALVVLMEDGKEHECEPAALAVSTALLGGARTSDLPMDIGGLAETALNRHAVDTRKRPAKLTTSRIDAPKVSFEKAAAKISEQVDPASVTAALALAAEATKAAIGSVVQRHAVTLEAVEKFLRTQDEELQILWWLIGGYSTEYDCPFDVIAAEAQPFVLATELSNHTEILPGPPSVKAILLKAGLKPKKKIKISDAVNSLRAPWAAEILEEVHPSPLTSPLHFAIERQLETGNGDDWIAGWAAASGIAKDFSLSAVQLAEAFYRERLLQLFK